MKTNEQLTRRWFEEGWGKHRAEVFKEIAPVQVKNVTLATGPILHLDQFLDFFHELTTALPDVTIVVERLVPTEDGTVTAWKLSGTHKGEGFGCKPTGKKVEATGTTWHTIEDGKIVGGHDYWNYDAFLKALGA